jgi:hypothetical protein
VNLAEAVERFLRADYAVHHSYGSTATCREGEGFFAGAAITRHCATTCNNPVHDDEVREYEEAKRAMSDLAQEVLLGR